MLKRQIMIFFAIIVTIMGCSSSPKVRVNFDRNEEISTAHYKTFAWLKETKILAMPDDINPVMKVRIDNAIERAFIARGYQLVDNAEKADFTISYTMGNRDKIKTDNFPVSYRIGFGWGYRYFGDIGLINQPNVRSYMEGKLAIDVYDVKSHQPVWHGWAVKRIKNADQDNPSKAIREVVEHVVEKFQ